MYDWNKVSKRGGGFTSSMPRSLAKELREQEEKAKEASKQTSLKRRAPDPPSHTSTLPSSNRLQNDTISMADPSLSGPYFFPTLPRSTVSALDSSNPKGCFCQMGSVFRALVFLCLILGVTGGLIYWIYMVHFLKEDGTYPDAKGTISKIKTDIRSKYPYYNRSKNYLRFLTTILHLECLLFGRNLCTISS